MSRHALPSLGLELELPVVMKRSGESADGRAALATLFDTHRTAGAQPLRTPGGELMGVHLPEGLYSFDNGYNNIEIALAPLRGEHATLERLAQRVSAALGTLEAALAHHDMAVVNLAEHPLCGTGSGFYNRMCGPKAIYAHWVRDRGWDHACGIDAKAQNGPTTGVAAARAVEALNTVLRAAPAFIALFANSPFENGTRTPRLENRLDMWPRMFARARHAADRRMCVLPEQPFADLGDYFQWMFAPDSVMHAVDPALADYKTLGELAVPEGAPSLREFLSGPPRPARGLFSRGRLTLEPSLRHFEQLQFSHFLDARIRFGFASLPPLDAFLDAWRRPHGLEALFEQHCSHLYIEGRAAGTCLADRELRERAGERAAASAPLAASALQAGLLAADDEAVRSLARRVPWAALSGLREAAMHDGLAGTHAGVRVYDVAECVLGLARDALPENERWTLDYAAHVMRDGASGAVRALRTVERGTGGLQAALTDLIAARHMQRVAPPCGAGIRAATAAD